MLTNDMEIAVTNRDNGRLFYTVPDLGVRRTFQPGETKEHITWDELKALYYTSGGEYILRHCLVIHNNEAVEYLLGKVEPEYFYTKETVKDLLQNGSLAQLEDCLDFAPNAVVDMVKDEAVNMKLNDIAKRKAILDKTEFNVSAAIQHNEEEEEDEELETVNGEKTVAKTRKAAPQETEPTRRAAPIETTASKYSVVADE